MNHPRFSMEAPFSWSLEEPMATSSRRHVRRYPPELRERAVRMFQEAVAGSRERYGAVSRIARQLGWPWSHCGSGLARVRARPFMDDHMGRDCSIDRSGNPPIPGHTATAADSHSRNAGACVAEFPDDAALEAIAPRTLVVAGQAFALHKAPPSFH